MRTSRFALSACFVILALPLFAWNNTGHELVAGIAWDDMTSQARANAIALLQRAPGNACLLELFSSDSSRPLDVRQREFFMRAATWSDIIRPRGDNDDRPCTQFHRREWHFIDHFWQGRSDGTGDRAPRDRNDIEIPDVNAAERLRAFRATVPCDGSNCPSESRRARHLAWILHLVGDVHQPLHTAARVTPNHPNGDAGGNSFPLVPPLSPLHTYWDRIIDTAIPRKAGEPIGRYHDRLITTIVAKHPRASMAARIHPSDFDAWALEGFATTKQSLYPMSLHIDEEPSEEYEKMALGIATEAIALGGYRLAALLNELLAP
jgi:hypothetical protein